mmetsp:Transcript_16336/g.38668  ORF Transcript_16336/g.38668 Transcript_16336/m.38668 type:complete len:332 (-) Transcript_16336:687-1682(-)
MELRLSHCCAALLSTSASRVCSSSRRISTSACNLRPPAVMNSSSETPAPLLKSWMALRVSFGTHASMQPTRTFNSCTSRRKSCLKVSWSSFTMMSWGGTSFTASTSSLPRICSRLRTFWKISVLPVASSSSCSRASSVSPLCLHTMLWTRCCSQPKALADCASVSSSGVSPEMYLVICVKVDRKDKTCGDKFPDTSSANESWLVCSAVMGASQSPAGWPGFPTSRGPRRPSARARRVSSSDMRCTFIMWAWSMSVNRCHMAASLTTGPGAAAAGTGGPTYSRSESRCTERSSFSTRDCRSLCMSTSPEGLLSGDAPGSWNTGSTSKLLGAL